MMYSIILFILFAPSFIICDSCEFNLFNQSCCIENMKGSLTLPFYMNDTEMIHFNYSYFCNNASTFLEYKNEKLFFNVNGGK